VYLIVFSLVDAIVMGARASVNVELFESLQALGKM
jgi:hypothetical protein